MTKQERLLSLIDRETGKAASLDSTFQSLDMDSLDFVSFMQEVEKEFDVTIPDAAYGTINTVGDIVELI